MSTTSAELTLSGLTGTLLATARNRPITWMKTRVEAYRCWRERRAAAAALSALDGHMLRDIGLDRSEIMSMAYGRGLDPTRRARG